MSVEPIVSFENVSKRFGKVQALDTVSMAIEPGSIIGLLGANGCGKSTLLRHIIGLYLPSDGVCRTFGREAAQLTPLEMARIGYVHQEGELLDWMTVGQLMRYVAAYYPGWNREVEEEYIAEFDVPVKGRVGSLSPGVRQKVAVLLAIGFEPELLILDEPAAAMDPIARGQFLDLLVEIIQDPKRTIIISSHILSDVEKVMDRVLIMDQGRILRNCSFDDLREEFSRARLTAMAGTLPSSLPFSNAIHMEKTDHEAMLTFRNLDRKQLAGVAEELNCRVEFLGLSLEDSYRLVVTGGQ